LPTIPIIVRIGDPASLLRRRPDVFAAERRLASATARIGVAVADLFPRVSLIGSFGYFSTSISDLLEESTQEYSFGPRLSWAAFDLGRVRARIRAVEASAAGQLAVYERTVLRALEETENAIVRYTREIVRRERLRIASDASEEAARLSRLRYEEGVDSFINVLDAERRLLEAQTQLAVSETEAARALIALYKALGGGWQYAFGKPGEKRMKAAPAATEVGTQSPTGTADEARAERIRGRTSKDRSRADI
jgi:multidrug efflux system outer membrane protein